VCARRPCRTVPVEQEERFAEGVFRQDRGHGAGQPEPPCGAVRPSDVPASGAAHSWRVRSDSSNVGPSGRVSTIGPRGGRLSPVATTVRRRRHRSRADTAAPPPRPATRAPRRTTPARRCAGEHPAGARPGSRRRAAGARGGWRAGGRPPRSLGRSPAASAGGHLMPPPLGPCATGRARGRARGAVGWPRDSWLLDGPLGAAQSGRRWMRTSRSSTYRRPAPSVCRGVNVVSASTSHPLQPRPTTSTGIDASGRASSGNLPRQAPDPVDVEPVPSPCGIGRRLLGAHPVSTARRCGTSVSWV
jgi:hypothetical protein